VQVKPVDGDSEDVREIVPVNPLTGATVIVEVCWVPAVVVTEVGLALTEKSVTVIVTVAICVRLLLVPVTDTVYVPALPVHDSAEV